MPHLPLSLERFAELSAAMDAGEPRDELLAREGLSLQVWQQAQNGWLAMMSAEVKRHRYEINQRYQAIYAAHHPELVGIEAAAEGIAPSLSGIVDETGIALGMHFREVLPFGQGDGVPARATDDEDGQHEEQVEKRPADVGATAFVSALDLGPVVPFQPRPAEVADEPMLAAVAERSAPVAPVPAMPAPATPAPAVPAQVAAAPVAPAPAPAAPEDPGVNETGFVAALDLGEALPFRAQAVAAPAPAAAEVEAEAAALVGATSFVSALSDEQLASERCPSIDTTGEVSALSTEEEALPFVTGATAVAPARAAAQEARPDLVGATAFVDAASLDLDALPFESAKAAPAAAAGPMPLSLEQYASLSVELAGGTAATRAATLAKYGVADDAAFNQLRTEFNRHFRADPSLHVRFRAAYDAYHRWLASQQR